MVNLTTSYAGLKLQTPLIVGSSGLTDSVDKLIQLEKYGAGAVVLKSLFEEEILIEMEEMKHQMTGRQFVYPETFDYMDEGPEEDSVRKYLNLIKDAKSKIKIPVVASINCVSSQKWTYFAKEIQTAGADAIELNIFVLPSDLNRSAEDNEKTYFDIIQKVTQQVSIPVTVKLSHYSSNLATHLKDISETGIKGMVLFNRFFSPDFDIDNFDVTSGNVLSGPGDISLPLRWISIMTNKVYCNLAASTGAHSGKDIIKLLLAGAHAVQVVSTLYKNGSVYIATMLNELSAWMDKHEFKSIDDFRGKMSQADSHDPAAYERVQFMKHFRQYVET